MHNFSERSGMIYASIIHKKCTSNLAKKIQLLDGFSKVFCLFFLL